MSRSELQRLKADIERYARDRDWENHASAVERLIQYVAKNGSGE